MYELMQFCSITSYCISCTAQQATGLASCHTRHVDLVTPDAASLVVLAGLSQVRPGLCHVLLGPGVRPGEGGGAPSIKHTSAGVRITYGRIRPCYGHR